MATRDDPAHEGRRNARRIRVLIGEEIREARLQGGLTQAGAGGAADMSHAQFGRIERGVLDELNIDQLSRACSAVGLRLVVKAYPDGDPVRDEAQRRLLERFRVRLPDGTVWRTEVPLPLPGDRRAWDGVAAKDRRVAACEAETALRDVQALERRIALKQRDGGIETVILVVSDTRANRRALAAHREALRERFPLDGREILAAFSAGRLPNRSGILML